MIDFTFIIFHWLERPPTQFDEIYFFQAKQDFLGLKGYCPFANLGLEKVKFFHRASICICTDIHKYVTGQIGLNLDTVLELEKTLSGRFGVLYFIFTSLRFFSQIWMQLQRAPDDTL